MKRIQKQSVEGLTGHFRIGRMTTSSIMIGGERLNLHRPAKLIQLERDYSPKGGHKFTLKTLAYYFVQQR
jgi:hypothetical protein